MEDVEQEAGAARPGAHDAPDAVAAHDTIDTAEAHAAKAAATAAPKRPKSAEEIMRLVEDKAAAEEGAPQGGSAGGGSDGSNLLEFKYGQSGTGVGQPCGYTREQFLQFAADPRMVTLPFVCAEIEEDIWQLLQTALTEIIEELRACEPAVRKIDVISYIYK